MQRGASSAEYLLEYAQFIGSVTIDPTGYREEWLFMNTPDRQLYLFWFEIQLIKKQNEERASRRMET